MEAIKELLSAEEFYKNSKTANVYENMRLYAIYLLQKQAEVIAEESKIIQCNNNKGCGIPYCDQLCYTIDKQSILTSSDKYIENLK